MTALNTAELQTLEIIAKRDETKSPSRSHLEKLFRLDLIEPCAEGVCMTPLGQKIVKAK